MNRLVLTARPVLARSFSATSARAGAQLPMKEQWMLDWRDELPVSLKFGIKIFCQKIENFRFS